MKLIKFFTLVLPILFLDLNARASSCADSISSSRSQAGRSLGGHSSPQSPLPSQYKLVATSDIGSLYYSEAAVNKGKELDAMISDLGTSAEIFGFGLTRTDGDRLIVEDFVIPASDKILTVAGLFIPKEVSALGTTLEHSQHLNLEFDDRGLFIKSDNSSYDIHVRREIWGNLRPLILQMCNCTLPEDYSSAVAEIGKTGIRLRTDWEVFIVGATRVLFYDNYAKRAENEASQRGLEMKFNMHHHPRLGVLVEILKEKGVPERIEYFTDLLTPSTNDLKVMDSFEADWFEIRTFGTINKVDSGDTTARYFDMREIRNRKIAIAEFIEYLFALKPEDSTEQIMRAANKLLVWFKSKNLSPEEVVNYALGSERFKELKAQAETLSRSHHERDKLILKLFRPG